MPRRTRKLALVLGFVALLAASCTDSGSEGTPATDARSPSPSVSPGGGRAAVCPNEAQALTDPTLEREGGLTGDIDADGNEDTARLVVDRSAEIGCRAFLVVESSSGTHSLSIDREGMTFEFGLPLLTGLRQIDGRPGLDVTADVISGASTAFAAVYTMGGGELEQLQVQDAPNPITDNLFAHGGSVGHIDAVDCAPEGGLFVSGAVPEGELYIVQRGLFEFDDGQMRLVGNAPQDALTLSKLPERYPEFAGPPFASCSA